MYWILIIQDQIKLSEIKTPLKQQAPACMFLQENLVGNTQFNSPSQCSIQTCCVKPRDGHDTIKYEAINWSTDCGNEADVSTPVYCSLYIIYMSLLETDCNSRTIVIYKLLYLFVFMWGMVTRGHLCYDTDTNRKRALFERLVEERDIVHINSGALSLL